jgi:predicted dehydrogenase
MYSASRNLGGGILLDCHEIDLLTWLLGPVGSVNCRLTNTGSIDIETEDLVCMTLEFRSGVIGTLQLDYLQRPCARRFHITGTKGTVIWDYLEHSVSCYSSEHKSWTRWHNPIGYDLNNMYIEQAKHFIDCISYGSTLMTPLSHAAHVLAVIDAARLSAADNGSHKVPTL